MQELLRTLSLSHFLWVVCLPLPVLFVCLFSLLDSDLCFPLARLSPAAQPRERDVIRNLRLVSYPAWFCMASLMLLSAATSSLTQKPRLVRALQKLCLTHNC